MGNGEKDRHLENLPPKRRLAVSEKQSSDHSEEIN